ncbi:hypothetical protein ATI61_11980 [Archangium gephyra]|uniref:Uncharacterized protein n=1 Tax=Archangium gephyra TaxID=48 RepID=A0AAC8Q9M7_9BACT|nr:hypothetical protein [Archangium gephyra]AKJ03670.1 Hypothetical protein AA314_05296 [Archangium gephyra]REG22550.1 hypothetical protein ATI61_11980 [Archangium gephyra]
MGEDLRRQLEGGLEVLEVCSARYRELSTVLQRRNWKEQLREAPGLLNNALRAESTLPEVLGRLQRRAEREPDRQGPANQWLRSFEEERTALSRHIARRLSKPAEGALAEQLGRLGAVALKPLPLPPGEGETVLLEGGARWPPFLHFLSFFVLWSFASPLVGILVRLRAGEAAGVWAATWVGVPLYVLFFAWFYVRTGHYWLTSERLLWKPRLGEPVQVMLSSLGDGQVTQGSAGTVKVRGRVRMTLRYVPNAWKLAALIAIHRRPEFRGVARRDPPSPMVILDMYRSPPGEPPYTEDVTSGVGMIRPGFVVYFPPQRRSLLLDAITGPTALSSAPAWSSRDKVDVPVSLLLEQLQLLPEERIDALLRKAAASNPESLLWEPRELKWSAGSSSWMEMVRGEEALWAHVPSWAAHQHLGRVLQYWRPQ